MWIIYVITSLRLSVSCAYIYFVLNQGGNESNQVCLLLLLLHLLFLLLFQGAFISTAVLRICFSFLSRWRRWSWIHPTTTTVQDRLVTRQDNEQGSSRRRRRILSNASCCMRSSYSSAAAHIVFLEGRNWRGQSLYYWDWDSYLHFYQHFYQQVINTHHITEMVKMCTADDELFYVSSELQRIVYNEFLELLRIFKLDRRMAYCRNLPLLLLHSLNLCITSRVSWFSSNLASLFYTVFNRWRHHSIVVVIPSLRPDFNKTKRVFVSLFFSATD